MIIATAGHVDHGKTALLRALTGTDADRLAEEKRRGMTIDLGYAYGGRNGHDFSFIDVPGHERFIRNMLAGVTGVDAVLLVIAADDGPMPQTREHLEILDLLGIRNGMVALTKADIVDVNRLAEVEAAVIDMLAPTSLAGAPCLPVSALTGENIDALADMLAMVAGRDTQADGDLAFRLSVDRVFTLDGAGLIATGTSHAGRLAVGDSLQILPGGRTVRVRGLRAGNRPVDSAGSGERIAINIAGADRDDIARGAWLTAPDLRMTGNRFDLRLLIPRGGAALSNWTSVEVSHGAGSFRARVALLEDRKLEAGETGIAQIVAERELHAARGDRVILRNAAGTRTLAGGTIIDPLSPQRGRARPERLDLLLRVEGASSADILAAHLRTTREGVDAAEICAALGLTRGAAERLVAGLDATDMGCGLIARERWEQLCADVTAFLATWHDMKPDAAGAGRAALAPVARAANLSGPAFEAAIGRMVAERLIRRAGATLSLPSHRPQLSPADEHLWSEMRELFVAGGLKPPALRDISMALGLDRRKTERFLGRCVAAGLAIRVADNRYFPPGALHELASLAAELDRRSDEGFTAVDFKDHTGIGRNVSIDLLEYFDRAGLTRRKGDRRRVVHRPEVLFPAS
jgi:selenocysteine-specific elongation factor